MGIDRTRATHVLAPERARILQCADVLRQAGCLTRCRGSARNEVTVSAATVTAAAAFERQDCKKILIDGATNGTVRMTPGRSENCAGPLPQWMDPPLSTGPDSPGLGPVPAGAAIVFELTVDVGVITSTPTLTPQGLDISGTINGQTIALGLTGNGLSFGSGSGLVVVSADYKQAYGYLEASDSIVLNFMVNGVLVLDTEVTMRARYRRLATGVELVAIPLAGESSISLSGAS